MPQGAGANPAEKGEQEDLQKQMLEHLARSQPNVVPADLAPNGDNATAAANRLQQKSTQAADAPTFHQSIPPGSSESPWPVIERGAEEWLKQAFYHGWVEDAPGDRA